MMLNRRTRLATGVMVVASAAFAVVGCGEADEASQLTEGRLRVIAAAYLDFAAARGAGPANERELRLHLTNTVAASLARQQFDVASNDVLYVSERDDRPFVLKYGLPVSVSPSKNSPAIAYEAQGHAGTRYVAYANGQVECEEESSLVSLLETMEKE